MDGGDSLRAEKSRICPSCRMQISVLAVKCQFCGEKVGKPKEEQRTLSINDLGGEIIHHRAPSGSVMEALEAFRVEADLEVGESKAKQPGEGGSSEVGSGDMPVAESESFDAEFESPHKSAITSVYESKPPTFQERFKTIGLIVGGITLLAFLGVQAPGWIDMYRASDADAVISTLVNEAPFILESGGPPIEALEAAVQAIEHEDSASNRKIAKEALAAVADQIHGLLGEVPFRQSNLSNASILAARALDTYADELTVELVEEVQADSTAYRMSLVSIDRVTKRAIFQPNLPGSPRVPVEKGEVLAERFYVRDVKTRSVVLEDKMRGNRVVEIGFRGIVN